MSSFLERLTQRLRARRLGLDVRRAQATRPDYSADAERIAALSRGERDAEAREKVGPDELADHFDAEHGFTE